MKEKIIKILKKYNLKYEDKEMCDCITVYNKENYDFTIQLDSEWLIAFDWFGISKDLLKPMIEILEVLDGNKMQKD